MLTADKLSSSFDYMIVIFLFFFADDEDRISRIHLSGDCYIG